MAETIIYTKTGCPYCKRTMEEYRAKGIKFKEINVLEDYEAKKKVKNEYGATKVPVVVVDGKVVQIGDSQGGG
ncbi:MAG: glutaredoxin [Peptococcaceae bacterium]|nr:glutaredoxin [Peptococcaceae bacterium]